MKQMVLTLTALAVIIGLITVVVLGSNLKETPVAGTTSETQAPVEVEESTAEIVYWGTTCPYCHDVFDWIEENAIEEKLTIIRKEVYHNQANSIDLSSKAQLCGLDTTTIGVPFMYTTSGECLVGFPDITGYLEQKATQEGAVESVEDATSAATTQEGGSE